MQEKLLKILKIKIEAINQNIDNLNFLNGELEKNNEDLEYIKDKITIFNDNNVLDFDNINNEDFNKILSMVDPSVAEIFKDKTCNYQGIIYIIQGIRQSISLELTDIQTKAIYAFIEGLKSKELNLQEVINNLEESKKRLPETDLTVLTSNLENYQNMISKSENNLYLTEIAEIRDALDFANTGLEEKVDIFEYLLKYNSDIYETIRNEDKNDFDSPYKEEIATVKDNYVPVEENVSIDNEVKEEPSIGYDLDRFTLNLNGLQDTNQESLEVPEEVHQIPITSETASQEVEVENNSDELDTLKLDDIIKKIDDKLKEMEETEKKEDIVHTIELDTPVASVNVDSNDILFKYGLTDLNISLSEDSEKILNLLEENGVLEDLKQKPEILTSLLTNISFNDLEDIIKLVQDNLVTNQKNLSEVLKIIVDCMPILMTSSEAMKSFRENIEFFKEKNINIVNLFDNYREMLVVNHDLILKNYDKVSKYGLTVNNDNARYLLYNRDILKNLDYYIEAYGVERGFLGKEELFDGLSYINKHPYKLNSISKDTLLKLRYVSDTNGKIYGNKPGVLSGDIANPKVDTILLTDEYIDNYFDGEYDFVDKNILETINDDIAFDVSVDENINLLDSKYKESDLKYKIGNTTLSRMKTIRIYNFLKNQISSKDALLVGLTYNSVIPKEEYENIVKVINDMLGGI